LDKPGTDGTSNTVLVAELQAEVQVSEHGRSNLVVAVSGWA